MRGAKRCKQRHAGTSARVFPKLSEYYFIKPAVFIRFERFSESKSRQKNRIRPGAGSAFHCRNAGNQRKNRTPENRAEVARKSFEKHPRGTIAAFSRPAGTKYQAGRILFFQNGIVW